MKTTTLILAVLMLGFLSTSSINAESVSEKQNTEKQLSDTIKSVFQNFPIEDFMSYNERCKLTVVFEINSNDKISNIHIKGYNRSLVSYALNQLTQYPVKVSPTFEHKKYDVDIQFVLR